MKIELMQRLEGTGLGWVCHLEEVHTHTLAEAVTIEEMRAKLVEAEQVLLAKIRYNWTSAEINTAKKLAALESKERIRIETANS